MARRGTNAGSGAPRAHPLRTLRVLLPVAVGVLVAFAVAHAAPSGVDVLRRAATASHTVSYRGVRMTTLWLEGRTEGIECIELADGHGRFRTEYSAPAAARGRIVVCDGKGRWQIEPRGKRVFHNAAPPADPEDAWNLPLLVRNYQVRLDGRQEVARRSALHLVLDPKHPGLPRRVMWVDAQNNVVLKREVRSADGAPIRWSAFTEIAFSPALPASEFHCQPAPGEQVVQAGSPWQPLDADGVQRLLGTPVLLRKEIPSLGFQLHSTLGHQAGAVRTVHLVYEDGISTLSLFIDGRSHDVAMRGGRRVLVGGRLGALRSDHHFAVLRWASGPLRYTLMGDLTPAALLQAGRDLVR